MKKLTWALGLLLVVFFALILWLCFFQFPSMDDYAGSYFERSYGLGGAVRWYLREHNGRFSTIPAFLAISSSHRLMGQYALLLIFFIAFTYSSVFCFVRVLSRHLFEPSLNMKWTALIAAMLLVIFLCSVPQVSTFIYWMATSVTYLFPFGIFLFLICAYSSLLKQGQRHKWGWTAIICLLTAFLGGSNEIMLFYSFAFPFLAGLLIVAARRPIPVQLYVVAGFAILLLLIILQIPGNSARAGHYIPRQPLMVSLAGTTYRTWQTLLPVFSNPLFYIGCLGIVVAAGYLKPSVADYFASKRSGWLLETACIVGMIFFFDLIIRQVGSEVLPLRATNIIVCLTILGCWWIILVNASRLRELVKNIHIDRHRIQPVFIAGFCIALMGSGFAWQLMKNIVVSPVHAAVMKQREAIILGEKAKGRNLATISPYRESAERIVKEEYKNKSGFVLEEFDLPPSFAYFMDEPNNKDMAPIYAEYYGIDTIAGAGGKFARLGLLDSKK